MRTKSPMEEESDFMAAGWILVLGLIAMLLKSFHIVDWPWIVVVGVPAVLFFLVVFAAISDDP